jgi:hypothetical protein
MCGSASDVPYAVHLSHSLTFNDPILGWIIAARTSIIALDRFSSRYVAQYLEIIRYFQRDSDIVPISSFLV